MTNLPPVVLFDGDCAFCNAVVRWTAQRDPLARLRYASLGSPVAPMVVALADPDRDFGALPDSVVFVDGAGVHTESEAALRIARRLRFPYPALAAVGLAVPRPIRDAAYRAFARRRRRVGAGVAPSAGGRSRPGDVSAETRRGLPPPDLAARMLDEDDLAGLRARAPGGGDGSP